MTNRRTGVPGAPVRVAAQVQLLAAQSTVAEGVVSAEVLGVALTNSSNRAGWLQRGFATQRVDNRHRLGRAAVRRCRCHDRTHNQR